MKPATNAVAGRSYSSRGPATCSTTPLVHDRDPVGHRQRLFLVVRHVDERRLRLFLDVLQLELHLLAQLQVECAERLVEQQGGRPVDQRPRERNALLLAARQLPRLALVHALQPDREERVRHPRLDVGTRDLLDLEPEGDVLPHGHVREERVSLEDHVDVSLGGGHIGHVAALEEDPSLGRLLEPGDHPQRGRLAAARRAEQREELSLADRQADVVDGLDAPEILRDVLENDVAVAVFGSHTNV